LNRIHSEKQNIALIIPGGIGTGRNNIGVPVLEAIVKRLSLNFSITIFQLYKTNVDYKVKGFDLVETYSRNPLVKYLRLIQFFRRHHKRKNFSVVHGFWAMPSGFFSVVFAKTFRIKSIVSVLGGDAISLPEINYGQLQKPLYKRLIFWSLRNADEVVTLTRYLVDNLNKAGFTRNDFKIIPWGIDTNLFKSHDRMIGNADVLKFLTIGNLHPVKDHETLLRAFKLIREQRACRLTIIGEGILLEETRRIIEDLGLGEDVVIKDPVPNNELPQYYSDADILLHTSLSEGQSEVVTEAMSSGLLVCGTRVGLMYDLPECCISVPVGNFTMLAKEIQDVLIDQIRIREICNKAITWTKEHSVDWTVAKIEDLYNCNDEHV
jgi:glycosyltransferase involved in cell wall biosynthesis